MKTAAVVYDSLNTIVRVEVRPSAPRALAAGEFFSKHPGYWYQLISDPELISLYQSMINHNV